MLHKLKVELFNGWTTFEKIYIVGLLLMQGIVFYFNPNNLIGMVAAVFGILGVTFLAKGKISTYFFGVIQAVSYLIVAYYANLKGEVIMNLFYLVTQFVGFYSFRNNLHIVEGSESKVVETKKLNMKQILLTAVMIIVGWFIIGFLLDSMNSAAPYVNSIATALSITAQVLTVKRFREAWGVWILTNLVGIILWSLVGNISMVFMYIGFLVNSIVGMYNWTKLEKTSLKRTENEI